MAETKPLALKEAQNLIRGSAIPFPALSRARGKIRFADLPALVAWLPTVRHDGKGVFRGHYPPDPGDLRRQSPLQPVALDREVAWARLIFAQQARRLDAFLRETREYETEIASGQNEAAMGTLDSIEREFGASLWVIENRIALLQLAHGLDRQKAYLSFIRGKTGNNVVSFIAFYISNRNEETMTPARFVARLVEQLDKWNLEKDLESYLRFRIANEDPDDDAAIAAILRHDTPSALVDHYDTFIRVAQAVALHGSETARQRFLVELRKLEPFLSDVRINKTLLLLGATAKSAPPFVTRNIAPFSAVAQGHLDRLPDVIASARRSDPVDSCIWFLEAQLAVDVGLPLEQEDGSVRTRVTNAAHAIVARTDDCEDAILTLSRIALNFTLMSFAKEISVFLDQYVSSEPLPRSGAILRAFLESRYLEPRVLRFLPSLEQRRQYADALLAAYGPVAAVLLELLRGGFEGYAERDDLFTDITLSSAIQAESATERLLAVGAYVQALETAQSLRDASSVTSRRRGARFEVFCLMKDGRFDESIDLVVRLCLRDPGMIRMLPLSACGAALDKSARKRLAPLCQYE